MNKKEPAAIVSSTAFYNEVAKEYDDYMTSSDDHVRCVVATKMKHHLQSGTVLDFGGGTGLDLNWLKQDYNVIFLEPSENMRAIAKANHGYSSNIYFVKSNIDFNSWSSNNMPFIEKADAILMNFAVLNCIKNIQILFEKLALISKPGTTILATVLNSGIIHLLKSYSVIQFLKIIFRNNIVHSYHNGKSHEAFLHKLSYIQKASKPYFKIQSAEAINNSPFVLLILKRI